MSLGISLGSLLSVNEIFDCTKKLQKYNVDSIWIPETWGMDCVSILSSISQYSGDKKIGSSIMNIYSRTPSLLAMTAITLDTISNGKFILGLGTSSESIVNHWHGLNFTDHLQRMREYVEIIRLINSGKKVSYAGKIFQLKNFNLLIPSKRKIPIYLAAINKKMVELTWDMADGVIFYLRPLSEMKNTISHMQQKRKIDVASQIITCVHDDLDKAIIRTKKTIAFYISVGKIYREFLSANGYSEETELIHTEYEKNGLSNNYELVTDDMVNALTICGTPQEFNKKLDAFTRSGITLPILQFNPVGNVSESFKLLLQSIKQT